MTASERLYDLARGGEGIRFSSAEVLALASLVEAAEMLVVEGRELHAPEYPSTLKSYRAAVHALTALRDALEGGEE